MLGKLLKYEMKASARTLLPLYVGTMVVALICGIQLALMTTSINGSDVWFSVVGHRNDSLLSMFMYLLFFGLCVAIVVLTIMIVVQRFNKSLIGDEGYLMFTLPVTQVQLLSSKLIAALLWVLIGTVVMGLSAIIMMVPAVFMNLGDLLQVWSHLWNELQYLFSQISVSGLQFASSFLSTIFSGLSSIVALILVLYLSIMVAQMEQFSKYRVIIAVVLFFLLNWAFGFVETGLFNLFGLSFFDSFDGTDLAAYNWLMWGDVLFTVIQCVICFAGTVWLMQKKLNL